MIERPKGKEQQKPNPVAQLEIIAGCMYSGKTDELHRRLRRARIAKRKIQLFKPMIDTRYEGVYKSNSHSGGSLDATPIKNSLEIFDLLEPDTDVVGIDEVQFLDEGLIEVIQTLVEERNIRVIAAGLDTDFRAEPFGIIPELLVKAEEVIKLNAICVVCGEDASRTQRIINGKPAEYDSPTILVGGLEAYEARCRKHHEVPLKHSD